MNGRKAKKLRRQARVFAEHQLRNLHITSTPKVWFRLYCRWAKLRALLGFPITQERMSERAQHGIRVELRPKHQQGGPA